MKEIRFSIDALMVETNGEINLIPYMIKLGLYEMGIPVILNPKQLLDDTFEFSRGSGGYTFTQKEVIVNWKDDDEQE